MAEDSMKIVLTEDPDPDVDFYYRNQFKIYFEAHLIWDEETWESVLNTCVVYRIEVNGRYAGDVIFQGKMGTKYIVDFGIFPEYQGKGIGKAVLEKVKNMGKKLTAVTRKETLGFFLKCGFVLKKTIRNYYAPLVDGYYIVFEERKT
jgi:ribosomal protein S18 acetylase RimI-like enzyme